MRRVPILALVMLLVPALAGAKPTGIQVELTGLAAQPFGTLDSGARTSDLVKPGGGYGARILYGFSRHLYAGASVSYFKNRKEYGYAVALPGPPSGGVRAPRDSAGAFVGGPASRSLSTLPFEGVVQLRTDRAKSLNGWVSLGVGITTSRAKVTVGTASASAIQHPVSATLGVGLVSTMIRDWEAIAGLEWHQAWSRGGGVWANGDDPRFLTYSIGVRYPSF